MNINIGDIITLKKAHPCGSFDWKVTRIGADFKLICCGCGREVMQTRQKTQKNIVKINGEKI